MSKKYIDIDNTIYGVKKIKDINDGKLKTGFAYILPKDICGEKIVLPYFGKTDEMKKCGIYLSEEDEIIIRKPITKKKLKKYSVKNTYTTDKDSIDKILSTYGVKSNDNLELMLGDTDEVFAPNICSTDNGLQMLIKKSLMKKQIDIKNYVGRFSSISDLSNNMRSLLEHG